MRIHGDFLGGFAETLGEDSSGFAEIHKDLQDFGRGFVRTLGEDLWGFTSICETLGEDL